MNLMPVVYTNNRLLLTFWDSNYISFCSDFSLSCDM